MRKKPCGWLIFAVMMVLGVPALAQAQPDGAGGVGEAEAVLWAQRLETAVQTGQFNPQLIDDRRLIDEAISVFDLEADQRRMFYAYALGEQLLAGMSHEVASGASYSFLRTRVIEGQRTALFRYVSPAGVNYQEWHLVMEEEGAVVASDMEVYLAGERMSRILRRMWIPVVADLDPDFARHMGDRNRMLSDHMDELSMLTQASQTHRFDEVVAGYEALPEPMRDEMVTMVIALRAYLMVEDFESYSEVAARFAQLHAGGSNAELALIDVKIIAEEYAEASALVEALNERVGGDPYLYSFHASIADAQGDYAQAQRHLDAGLAEDPGLIDLLWYSMDLALWEEDWPRVSAMLSAVEAQGVEPLDLTEIEGFEGYVASKAYQRWLAAREVAEEGGPGE